MITGKDIYDVFAAIVPLYVGMILAYGSVRWWKIFTPEQCAGINRFVAVFAVPLLSFHFISTNNIYAMNYRFIAADTLQKVVILTALVVWQTIAARRNKGSLEWMITLFSLASLPNTLVMGIPLLSAMYGSFSGGLMVQIVVLQSVIWYTLMLFLFEYRGAKLLISDQFPDTAGEITSFRVESDVVSLNGREPLQADAEIGADGKLHVVVRRSTTASSSMLSSYYGGNKSNINSITSITPRISNLTGVEIYSIQSSREPTPRASSFNQSDFYKLFASKASSPARNGIEVFSVQGTPRAPRFGRSMSGEFAGGGSRYPTPNLMISGSGNGRKGGGGGGGALENGDEKDVNMFVWSSSESPGSEDHGNVRHGGDRGGGGGSSGFAAVDASKAVLQHEIDAARGMHDFVGSPSPARKVMNGEKEVEIREVPKFSTQSPHTKKKKQVDLEGDVDRRQHMPPASVMTRLILIMVWRKLIRNPNTYSSLFGLAWSLISFRWNIEMPTIVKGSISILSDAGLGMAMFSLAGLFMALQPKLIACGKTVATFAMAVRFLTGPAVIAATSIAIGLRGVLLHVAIVQAALPQGIVPFVFAKEYNVHPDILSTGVIFGMLISLPITILYYVLLGV